MELLQQKGVYMCRVNFKDVPERSLEPPEDRRQVYADCVVCGEPIREYDDCYEFEFIGCICERCVSEARRVEVTLF